jgi:hypothetical protein
MKNKKNGPSEDLIANRPIYVTLLPRRGKIPPKELKVE